MSYSLSRHMGEYFVAMGRHSKIPDCCIIFWDTVYMPSLTANKGRVTSYWKKLNKKKSFGYIPCPECFKNDNRVKIHLCTTRCKKWYIENGFEHLYEKSNAPIRSRRSK